VTHNRLKSPRCDSCANASPGGLGHESPGVWGKMLNYWTNVNVNCGSVLLIHAVAVAINSGKSNFSYRFIHAEVNALIVTN